MNEQEYRTIPGVRSSTLKNLTKSPLHCKHEETTNKVARYLSWGDLVHCLLLTPLEYPAKFVVSPYNEYRTKVSKEWRQEQYDNDITPITKSDLKAAEKAIANVHAHAVAQKVVKDIAEAETLYTWTNQDTGLECKARIDAYLHSGYLLDVKTTADVQPHRFVGSYYKFGYDVQMPHYSEGLAANDKEVNGVMILAIENVAPYDVVVFDISQEMLTDGNLKRIELLETYKKCTETDTWPGVSSEIVDLLSHREYREQRGY